jgi:predicted metal-binding protein
VTVALLPVARGTAVVACNTCRRSADPAGNRSGGAALVAALRAVKAQDTRYASVEVQEMPCLFACKDSCTVHLRASGKVGYVMGKFEPDEDAARAILDYAVQYHASDIGQVPYRDWPAGVKGHFLTRTPPEGYIVG